MAFDTLRISSSESQDAETLERLFFTVFFLQVLVQSPRGSCTGCGGQARAGGADQRADSPEPRGHVAARTARTCSIAATANIAHSQNPSKNLVITSAAVPVQ